MNHRQDVISEIAPRTRSRFDERRLRAVAMWAEIVDEGLVATSDPSDVIDLSSAALALMAESNDLAA